MEPAPDAYVQRKIDALLCHRSQWRSTMGIDADGPAADAQHAAFAEVIRAGIAAAGGEAFKHLDDL